MWFFPRLLPLLLLLLLPRIYLVVIYGLWVPYVNVRAELVAAGGDVEGRGRRAGEKMEGEK